MISLGLEKNKERSMDQSIRIQAKIFFFISLFLIRIQAIFWIYHYFGDIFFLHTQNYMTTCYVSKNI